MRLLINLKMKFYFAPLLGLADIIDGILTIITLGKWLPMLSVKLAMWGLLKGYCWTDTIK